MMFIYKITEVKICVSLRKHHDVTLAENDLAAYAPCLGPHRKLILTAILQLISSLNNIHSENRKITIFMKIR